MFAHIKTQVENPRMPKSGFSLDKIMLLHINLHKLALILGCSYIELSKWLHPDIAVNVLFSNKSQNIYKARRSARNKV